MLLMCCCVINYSKTKKRKWRQTTNICYLAVCVGQELGSSLGGPGSGHLFGLHQAFAWAKSHLKTWLGLAGLRSGWLTRMALGRVPLFLNSCWQGTFVSCHMGLSTGLCDVSSWYSTWLSPELVTRERWREIGQRCIALYDLSQAIISTSLYSLGVCHYKPTLKVKQIRQPLERWIMKNFGAYLKTTTMENRRDCFRSPSLPLKGPVAKNPPANAGDLGDASSIPGLGRSPGGGNGNPLQYSCLENPMDRGAWRPIAHRITEDQTRL